jgi:hypothetical protein
LKNASDDQIELFKINLKDIVNAKFPEKSFLEMMADKGHKVLTPGTKEYEAYLKKTRWHKADQPPVTSIKEQVTSVKEPATEAFKGWTPTVIKGGKEPKFNEGGIAELNAELNQLPEYYLPMAEGGRIPYGVGDWVKKKIKKKIKPYTKEGRDEHKKEWLEKKNIDMTVAEWNALSVKEKAKIWLREGNADGGIANHFRTR